MQSKPDKTVVTPTLKATSLSEEEVPDNTRAHPCNLTQGVVQPKAALEMI